MRISITAGRGNVGREDRVARAGVALSLLLLGSFALVLSRDVGLVSVAFGLLLGYFALTAALGWDPVYARAGIDTRSDAEAGTVRAGAWDGADTASAEQPTAVRVPGL